MCYSGRMNTSSLSYFSLRLFAPSSVQLSDGIEICSRAIIPQVCSQFLYNNQQPELRLITYFLGVCSWPSIQQCTGSCKVYVVNLSLPFDRVFCPLRFEASSPVRVWKRKNQPSSAFEPFSVAGISGGETYLEQKNPTVFC